MELILKNRRLYRLKDSGKESVNASVNAPHDNFKSLPSVSFEEGAQRTVPRNKSGGILCNIEISANEKVNLRI